MGAEFALPVTLEERGPGRPYVAYPSRETPRWVLPVDRKARRASLAMYQPQRLRGRLLKTLLERGFGGGERVFVRESDEHERAFAEQLDADVRLAYAIGGKGVSQKAIAQIMSPDGGVLAYAKLARRPSAIVGLENEAAMLARLATVPEIVGRVPRLLHWERSSSGASLLVSAGPGSAGPRRFGHAHIRFLRRLHGSRPERVAFRDSGMARFMAEALEQLSDTLSRVWGARLGRALSDLEHALAPKSLLVGLAHRDFTPWNTRVRRDGGLFVFDWESAVVSYPLWYDRFHHRFMTHVLTRGSVPLSKARIWTSDHEYDGDGSRFFLAYLVEVALTYHLMLVARGGTVDDAVLRETARLLDRQDEWYR